MGLEIRLVREDELEEVGRITVEAYQADGLLVEDVGYERVLADTASRAEQAEVWVAVDGDEVLGGVTFCRPGTPYAELAGDREGEFRMLAVDPRLRRRGAARALVQHCLARSQELAYDALVLSSMARMTGAHRLYEELGFERVPGRDWTPVPGVDLLAFRRLIGPPG
jgi:ribosomal protein S18 acetylase RimI-like enzyme